MPVHTKGDKLASKGHLDKKHTFTKLCAPLTASWSEKQHLAKARCNIQHFKSLHLHISFPNASAWMVNLLFFSMMNGKLQADNLTAVFTTAGLHDTSLKKINSPHKTRRRWNWKPVRLLECWHFGCFQQWWCLMVKGKRWFCQTTLKTQSVLQPLEMMSLIQTCSFFFNSTGCRELKSRNVCAQIARPQSGQGNGRTTAWGWWLNTDGCFLISVRKPIWSTLKAAKPLQVKTFQIILKGC